MARFVASFLALLAFFVSTVGGVAAGNPPAEVLSRAILALFLFFALGWVLGGAAQLVVSEYARQKDARTEAYRQRLSAPEGGEDAAETPVEGEAAGMA